MRYIQLAVIIVCVIALAGISVSCGRRGSGIGTNNGLSQMDTDRSLAAERAIEAARAYVPPEEITNSADYDPLVFEMLRNEFIRQIKIQGERTTSAVPTGDAGRVTDLSYDSGSGMLNWSYVNTGDYDSSGEVGIPDITMIAQYYLANTTDGLGDDALESWIDGDKSGEVGISDITPIAQGYLNDVENYRILTSTHADIGFNAIGMDIPVSSVTDAPLSFSAQIPDGALVFVAVAPVDGDGTVGDISNQVIFAYSIFRGVPSDTIFLYTPRLTVNAGEWTYVFVCANVAEGKPLAGITARILVDQGLLNATEIGCMASSETNLDFQNLFADTMSADSTSCGDVLYPGFATVDFWKTFADQTNVTLIASPSLPQPSFVDVGVYWDYRNNFIEKTGVGILAVIKFRGITAGNATLLIQGRDGENNIKTVYDDLEANNYEFANIGDLVTINVS